MSNNYNLHRISPKKQTSTMEFAFLPLKKEFSFHKLIVDKEDRPIDCEFIEVNKAFENLTGLKSNQIIGKKISEVLLEVDHHVKRKWFEVASYVALTGNEDSFQHYSETSKDIILVDQALRKL